MTATVAALLLPAAGAAVEIYTHFPHIIHRNEKYVIYSHGLSLLATEVDWDQHSTVGSM
jgi:hypothetical protein